MQGNFGRFTRPRGGRQHQTSLAFKMKGNLIQYVVYGKRREIGHRLTCPSAGFSQSTYCVSSGLSNT